MSARRKTGEVLLSADWARCLGGAEGDALRESLVKFTGQTEFRPGQEAILRCLLAGESVLGLLPTGGGKSLCFQLPARLGMGPVLVISPLLALMQDQLERARALGLRARRIEAAHGPDAVAGQLAAWEADEVDLLFVSPERATRADFRQVLQRLPPGLIAIDEAHCLSEWGHHFRPDYLGLGGFCRDFAAPVLALSATATPRVEAEICQALGIDPAAVVRVSPARPNLALRVIPAGAAEKSGVLVEGLGEAANLPAIVYATRQETTETIATGLNRAGLAARAYHAGLRREAREEIQRQFLAGELAVVVATIAFGMGIDKADLRSVWLWNLPASLEALVQQTGRAGRDGRPALGVVLADAADRIPLRNFAHGDRPSLGALRQLLEILLGQPQSVLRLFGVSQSLDLKPETIETVVALATERGWIVATGRRFSGAKLRLVRSRESALRGLGRGQRALAAAALERARVTRWGLILHWQEAAQALECDEAELRALFADLAASEDLTLRPHGLELLFASTAEAPRPAAAARALEEHFDRLEQSQLGRVDEVLTWCRSRVCLARQLEVHFGGEEGCSATTCGQCSACQPNQGFMPERLPDSTEPDLDMEEVRLLRELVDENHAALRQPRQMARFLAGLASPASRAARLTGDQRFGCLSAVPFEVILAYAQEALPGRE